MKLREVIVGCGLNLVQEPGSVNYGLETEITSVSCDSRQSLPGTLFFALAGTKTNGAQFAQQAVSRGAVVVVSETPIAGLNALVMQTPNCRRAMAVAAANFYGRPAQAMTLLGITGTNGKTTTSYLVESMLAAASEKAGVIGTVNYRFGGNSFSATHTTPESNELQKLLAQMLEAGTTSVVMEVSSHALSQDRVHGLSFTAAAFTNLTRDHLDYHQNMESYFLAKRRLFTELCSGPTITNIDDSHGVRLFQEMEREGRTVWGFSTQGRAAELWAREINATIDGISAVLVTPRGEAAFSSPLVGNHNLENILTAAGLVLGAGIELSAVVKGIENLKNVPGRLERINNHEINIFVDYAHSDDALSRASAALRPYVKGRLITVFGCGGDRDRGKRPLMGAAAVKGSDLVIVTSDNPRSEDPLAIIEEIIPGISANCATRLTHEDARLEKRGWLVEVDRRKAIELAVSLAKPSDVILLAGKGHEDYQIIGSEKLHFDDREEARRALEMRS